MDTQIGIRPSVGSSATNVQGRISPLTTKIQRWIASVVKRTKKSTDTSLSANEIRKAIPALAVVGGAAAFGLWQDSISAGLFACFALFFLAGIFKALQRIVATLRWKRDRAVAPDSDWNTSGTAERSEQNFEVGAKAIEHLRPWVEDETSLTEESAKAYCSVLLDTFVAIHPKFTE